MISLHDDASRLRKHHLEVIPIQHGTSMEVVDSHRNHGASYTYVHEWQLVAHFSGVIAARRRITQTKLPIFIRPPALNEIKDRKKMRYTFVKFSAGSWSTIKTNRQNSTLSRPPLSVAHT
jgi:hypothetical protein